MRQEVTPGNWKPGISGTVVSDETPKLAGPDGGRGDIAYYGGYLICESIASPADQVLLASAKRLLAACKEAREAIGFAISDDGSRKARQKLAAVTAKLNAEIERAEGEA